MYGIEPSLRLLSRRASRLVIALALALVLPPGCGDGDGGKDASAGADLAAPPLDMARALDAAVAPDLARPADLSVAPDLSTPEDLATPPDMAVTRDLVVVGGPCVCANNQFCKYIQVNSCSGAGVCMPRPQVCGLVLDPVCGCDGKDYDNECMANGAGTDIAHKGMCP